MNRNKLKSYAPQARREFIRAVTDRAAYYGLKKGKTEPITQQGDTIVIQGRAFPKVVAEQRRKLEERISRENFNQVMEAVAYTWFNRFVAIRYMELHNYFDHGYRVLSNPEGNSTPEILEHAQHVELSGLDKDKIIELKLDGTKDEELYRLLLVFQCNTLNRAMPFLFERVQDETELLLPDNLLHSDSLIRKFVREIDEENWQEVEIIGWIYQFYISEKKDEVIGKVVKSEDIPAATQLFTPNWIVKYLVQNSIGRQWMATYPNSPLKEKMEYYIEPAEQTPEVQAQLDAMTPKSLNPEEMTLLDPACGSGHILVEAYDLFKAIYQERGYRAKDIPRLILRNNLFGLEIDERAAQLASFALIMKARADDRRLLDGGVCLNVHCILSSDRLDADAVFEALTGEEPDQLPPGVECDFIEDAREPLLAQTRRLGTTTSVDVGFSVQDIRVLLALFSGNAAETYGALIQIPDSLIPKLPEIATRACRLGQLDDLHRRWLGDRTTILLRQATLLGSQFDTVVTNPPYMGRKYLCDDLEHLLKRDYPDYASDLYTSMISRCVSFCRPKGLVSMITMDSWMFGDDFTSARSQLIAVASMICNAHLGPRAFDEISGEVVQTCAFALLCMRCPSLRTAFFRLTEPKTSEAKRQMLLRGERRFDVPSDFFEVFPRKAMAYFATPRTRDTFVTGEPLSNVAEAFTGLQTGSNERFIRLWAEVDIRRIGFNLSLSEARLSGHRWYPYVKGSDYRKWYGNLTFVVNWENDGEEIRAHSSSTVRNSDHYFSPGLAYNNIAKSFCARLVRGGAIFDQKNSMFIAQKDKYLLPTLGFLHSKVVGPLLEVVAPKDFNPGSLKVLPVEPALLEDSRLVENVRELVAIAEADWNATEVSWDFAGLPWLTVLNRATLSESWEEWSRRRNDDRKRTADLECSNNRLFMDAYGLEKELAPSVSHDEITLQPPDRKDDCRRLLSFAVGCIMGRYSLDEPGLIYAHSGNEGFDPNRYKTFAADEDGIIPLTDFEWFNDDATNRCVEFVSAAWPTKHLDENLRFVAESLGTKRGEQPKETIRRYLANEFYKDHVQTYKKRPIHWLFSSGKQKAFQALVYVHRYNAGTLVPFSVRQFRVS